MNNAGQIAVRYGQEVAKALEELQKKYPDDLDNPSKIFRAGVMHLYHTRITHETDSALEIKQLMKRFPEQYLSGRDVIRSAIRFLHKHKMPKEAKK